MRKVLYVVFVADEEAEEALTKEILKYSNDVYAYPTIEQLQSDDEVGLIVAHHAVRTA